MELSHTTIIVSVGRALLGEVFPALRAVSYDTTHEKTLLVTFYIDGEPSEEDIETISSVETEIIADFPASVSVRALTESLDTPTRLPLANYVFRRREA